jgi:hypothetical protein
VSCEKKLKKKREHGTCVEGMICKTKIYFPPEPKTDTTAQLEKKVPPAHAQ